MQIFHRHAELLERLDAKGHSYEILGCAPDGQPLVCVRTGGDKTPAIFISAGSHSTEQAGVSAAMELIDTLDTEHQVYIIPCRDPIGLNGFAYALSLSLGEEPQLADKEAAVELLRARGEVLHEEEDLLVALIGEHGYFSRVRHGWSVERAPALEPLRGRRVYCMAGSEKIEGSAMLQRAYSLIVDPDGQILHINRFHDTAWAPVEARVTRNLMAQVDPALTLDLHEHGRDGFWFSARHQGTDDHQQWEQRMADAIIGAVEAAGTQLMPDDYLPGSFFTKTRNSVYWLDPRKRGEGFNLSDFAALKYGPAFTVETGMPTGFANRVSASLLAARTAIGVFEQRYL
ncbi:MAG: hypothetical protein QGG05_00780 [Candidatus Latescibacteria bacterium]|jgi:hypothetical protein|nr:hypothetical protein [Candidatus Latescibacterota bacterium]